MREPDYSILAKLRPPTSKNNHKKSYVGQKFNRLTVYSLVGYTRDDNARSYWLCRCDCGSFSIVALYKLKKGTTKSCGCYRHEACLTASTTHGMSRTPVYCRWTDMLTRVNNPNTKSAKDYIDRGITACNGLRRFENFYALLGDPPPKHEIDRMDNEGNYSCGSCEECLSKNWPMNVHWVPKKVNLRNKRNNVYLTHNNETRCVGEWAEILNLSPLLIAKRKRAGWPDDECLGFKERPSADRYRRKSFVIN